MATRPIKKIVLLPPVRETEEVEIALMREAARLHVTLSEIRRRCYRQFVFGDPHEDGAHAESVFPDSAEVEPIRAMQGVTR